jgi:hypothetical protein
VLALKPIYENDRSDAAMSSNPRSPLNRGCVPESSDAEDESPSRTPLDLPATVFEDKGERPADVPPDIAVVVPQPGSVREAIGAVLQQQSTGSPLWTAYASHEMAQGSVKVILPSHHSLTRSNNAILNILSSLLKPENARSVRNCMFLDRWTWI